MQDRHVSASLGSLLGLLGCWVSSILSALTCPPRATEGCSTATNIWKTWACAVGRLCCMPFLGSYISCSGTWDIQCSFPVHASITPLMAWPSLSDRSGRRRDQALWLLMSVGVLPGSHIKLREQGKELMQCSVPCN